MHITAPAKPRLPPEVLARLSIDRAAVVMLARMAQDYERAGLDVQALRLREAVAERTEAAHRYADSVQLTSIPAFPG